MGCVLVQKEPTLVIRYASHVLLKNSLKETLALIVEIIARDVTMVLISVYNVAMIPISKTASACVMMASLWRMEVAQSVETHARLVSTGINVRLALQDSTLVTNFALNVAIMKLSKMMHASLIQRCLRGRNSQIHLATPMGKTARSRAPLSQSRQLHGRTVAFSTLTLSGL